MIIEEERMEEGKDNDENELDFEKGRKRNVGKHGELWDGNTGYKWDKEEIAEVYK